MIKNNNLKNNISNTNFDVNLEYYKIFYHVAKNGGITAAAKELSMSQPAVSQQISGLEKQLGVSLFKRSGRGIALTSEGSLLYKYVEKGYEEILQGEKRLSQLLHLEAGEVRVGASDMTLRFFLLPYLEKFHQLYPGIKVTVTNGPTPETLKYLEDDRIDFGVVSSPFPEYINKENITYIDVREIQDCFVAGRSFIQYKNHMIDLQELENLPLITLEGQTSSGRYVTEFLKKNNITIHPEFELATSDMIVQFAERSLGVGMVVRDFAKEDLDNGKLFELRFKQRIPPRHLRLVTDTKRPQSLASAKLLELIKAKD
ncbi:MULTISPECIES: LysR family transcriptional regulator [Butyrivibrio]|jgi:DNA-binding transcriptional LysR family regulator|uniref:LysR family transcriptional regulator n=1 Tax=Butyrivibrio fibrisolvens TaxID=831 RepID=A0A317G4X0_BUTFI|nr:MULTISPECIES: LysR family transcriptional regulator [Butyrivibrio]PWT29095.1 LysR family transcriptional regulator [Butyrivibrio fibrisolvens]SEP76009.1 DNA-binding transcriptional regulator, LysR family [Butyrivibrio sp. TB]